MNAAPGLFLRILLIAMVLSSPVSAEVDHHVLDPAASGGRFDEDIQSPGRFLGMEIGERAITHEQLASWLEYLAAHSDRVELSTYGETLEGRSLYQLVISEPDNLARLDTIKRNLEQIGAGTGDRRALIESTPAVAWMGYGIHGDELSSSDAAIMLAWRLAAGEDEAIRELRRNLVVYIDPMHNPDGRARALAHVDVFRRSMPATDPQDMVHNQFWEDGRGNHYFFDLNRDALFQVQQQSRDRVRAMRAANPQLHVASHEMGADDTYLFAVPARPLNPFLPEEVHQSWADFSRDHSAAFDREGISYYTRAWNEVFYSGYYDILPAYYGSVPILYEQAATSGLAIELPSGKVRDFRTGVAHHFRSSMANLLTASRQPRDPAHSLGRGAPCGQGGRRRGRLDRAARQSVQVPRDAADRDLARSGCGDPRGADPGPRPALLPGGRRGGPRAARGHPQGGFPPVRIGSRPQHVRLSRAHVGRVPAGRETQSRSRRGHADLRCHGLVPAAGLRCRGVPRRVGAAGQLGSLDRAGNGPVPDVDGVPAYGYLYEDDSLHATARLLDRGVRVRAGNEPFVLNGRTWPAGTLLVRQEEQDENVDVRAALNEEAANGAIRLVGADSARITEGGPDLGGDAFTLLRKPRIAVLGGTGVSVTSFGAIWHLLDGTIGVPATLLAVDDLGDTDLASYDVLILPEVDADDATMAARIGGDRLQRWIESGGTLVTVGEASQLVTKADWADLLARGDALEDYPPLMPGRSARRMAADDFLALSPIGTGQAKVLAPVIGGAARHFVDDEFEPFGFGDEITDFATWAGESDLPRKDALELAAGLDKYLPHGAYLKVELKPKHWLNYGVGTDVPALFREQDALIAPAGGGLDLAGRYAGVRSLMMSGLVWPEATGYIAGTAWLVRQEAGDGQWIAFANNPVFRGYSLGTERLFLNAVLMGSAYR
ncbi:MAG: M14 family zinc carboxypeptidase [Gammaproteobacteria bacterium]|nr:M14 family zinc carboxypeptidase [Gammaproteobacteria bacterium]